MRNKGLLDREEGGITRIMRRQGVACPKMGVQKMDARTHALMVTASVMLAKLPGNMLAHTHTYTHTHAHAHMRRTCACCAARAACSVMKRLSQYTHGML